MPTHPRRFVVCVRAGSDGDVEFCKLYEALRDDVAERRGLVRIVDESGEDYLYPAGWFVAVEVPRAAHRRLSAAVLRRSTRRRAKPALQLPTPARRR